MITQSSTLIYVDLKGRVLVRVLWTIKLNYWHHFMIIIFKPEFPICTGPLIYPYGL